MARESRSTFAVRWLERAGLLSRYPRHTPEQVLAAEGLVPVVTARGWTMRREEGSVLGPIADADATRAGAREGATR
jgi:hypothetical protein